MVEGELKKRVHKELYKFPVVPLQADEILEIVDEAKKDVPVDIDFIEKRGDVITLEAHELGIKKLRDAILWFLKWFGDSS